ncbi:bL21 family ribosomal protein [bacterium]|nr:bL21 family ribosomal protein [bacterium]
MSDLTFENVLCIFDRDGSVMNMGAPFVKNAKIIAERILDKQ